MFRYEDTPTSALPSEGRRDSNLSRKEVVSDPIRNPPLHQRAVQPPLAERNESKPHRTEAERILEFVSAARLSANPPASRAFLVSNLIPARNVTLLSGDGGTGKSLLALMLSVAVSYNCPWLGIDVEHGKVVFVSAEDELEEVHRRLVAICDAEGINLAVLDRLDIVPLADKAAVMAAETGIGSIKPTGLWNALSARVERIQPALVVIDNVADVFAGNESSRAQVRQFVSMVRALAFKANCAVLLLSHPSVAGMQTGTGLSGSTAWNNSVRSRLYLKRPPEVEGEIADPDARILESKKANYAPLAAEIRLRYSDGRFLSESIGMPLRLDKPAVEAKAERIFLDLLQQFHSEGRDVSANPSRTYAPTQFAGHADAGGLGKRALVGAMNRLLRDKRIRLEKFGPPSRLRSRLVSTTFEGGAE